MTEITRIEIDLAAGTALPRSEFVPGAEAREIRLEAFRARLRFTAAALEIPETEIAHLLKVHPRAFNSGHWIMTKLLPWANTQGVSFDWLLLGDLGMLVVYASKGLRASDDCTTAQRCEAVAAVVTEA